MFPKQKASSSWGFRHWSVQFPNLHSVMGCSYVILPLLPGWLSGSAERQIKESARGKSGHTVNPIVSHTSVYRKWRKRHCIVLTPQKKIWRLTGGGDGIPMKDWRQCLHGQGRLARKSRCWRKAMATQQSHHGDFRVGPLRSPSEHLHLGVSHTPPRWVCEILNRELV